MQRQRSGGNTGRKYDRAVGTTRHGVVYVWHLIGCLFTNSLSIYFEIGDVLSGSAFLLVRAATAAVFCAALTRSARLFPREMRALRSCVMDDG